MFRVPKSNTDQNSSSFTHQTKISIERDVILMRSPSDLINDLIRVQNQKKNGNFKALANVPSTK